MRARGDEMRRSAAWLLAESTLSSFVEKRRMGMALSNFTYRYLLRVQVRVQYSNLSVIDISLIGMTRYLATIDTDRDRTDT